MIYVSSYFPKHRRFFWITVVQNYLLDNCINISENIFPRLFFWLVAADDVAAIAGKVGETLMSMFPLLLPYHPWLLLVIGFSQ
jgi:hypothetical protein